MDDSTDPQGNVSFSLSAGTFGGLYEYEGDMIREMADEDGALWNRDGTLAERNRRDIEEALA